MLRNLLLTGGPPSHDFDALALAVSSSLAREDIESDIVNSLDEFIDRLVDQHRRPDLITVFALHFTMAHPRYDQTRDRWAAATDGRLHQAIGSYLAGGGGMIAMHTACVCFDDWPGWGELLGASWDWKTSSHGPIGEAKIESVDIRHPIIHGIGQFKVTDEIYESLAVRSGFDTLLTCNRAGAAQPVVWARRHGDGRVVVDTLGHNTDSLAIPTHDLVLRRSARWVMGQPDDAVIATAPTHGS